MLKPITDPRRIQELESRIQPDATQEVASSISEEDKPKRSVWQDIKEGASSGLDRLQQSAAETLQTAADFAGGREEYSNYQNRRAQRHMEDAQKLEKNLGGWGQVANMAVQSAPTALSYAIPGTAAARAAYAAGVGGTQEFGDIMGRFREEGKERDAGAAGKAALVAAGIDAGIGKFMPTGKAPFQRVASDAVSGALSGSQHQVMSNLATDNPWDMNIGMAAVGGGVAGGGISGLNAGLNFALNKGGQKSITDMRELDEAPNNVHPTPDFKTNYFEHANASEGFSDKIRNANNNEEAAQYIDAKFGSDVEYGAPTAYVRAMKLADAHKVPLTDAGHSWEMENLNRSKSYGNAGKTVGIDEKAQLAAAKKNELVSTVGVRSDRAQMAGETAESHRLEVQKGGDKAFQQIQGIFAQNRGKADDWVAELELSGESQSIIRQYRTLAKDLKDLETVMKEISESSKKDFGPNAELIARRVYKNAFDLGRLNDLKGLEGEFDPLVDIQTADFLERMLVSEYPSYHQGSPDLAKEKDRKAITTSDILIGGFSLPALAAKKTAEVVTNNTVGLVRQRGMRNRKEEGVAKRQAIRDSLSRELAARPRPAPAPDSPDVPPTPVPSAVVPPVAATSLDLETELSNGSLSGGTAAAEEYLGNDINITPEPMESVVNPGEIVSTTGEISIPDTFDGRTSRGIDAGTPAPIEQPVVEDTTIAPETFPHESDAITPPKIQQAPETPTEAPEDTVVDEPTPETPEGVEELSPEDQNRFERQSNAIPPKGRLAQKEKDVEVAQRESDEAMLEADATEEEVLKAESEGRIEDALVLAKAAAVSRRRADEAAKKLEAEKAEQASILKEVIAEDKEFAREIKSTVDKVPKQPEPDTSEADKAEEARQRGVENRIEQEEAEKARLEKEMATPTSYQRESGALPTPRKTSPEDTSVDGTDSNYIGMGDPETGTAVAAELPFNRTSGAVGTTNPPQPIPRETTPEDMPVDEVASPYEGMEESDKPETFEGRTDGGITPPKPVVENVPEEIATEDVINLSEEEFKRTGDVAVPKISKEVEEEVQQIADAIVEESTVEAPEVELPELPEMTPAPKARIPVTKPLSDAIKDIESIKMFDRTPTQVIELKKRKAELDKVDKFLDKVSAQIREDRELLEGLVEQKGIDILGDENASNKLKDAVRDYRALKKEEGKNYAEALAARAAALEKAKATPEEKPSTLTSEQKLKAKIDRKEADMKAWNEEYPELGAVDEEARRRLGYRKGEDFSVTAVRREQARILKERQKDAEDAAPKPEKPTTKRTNENAKKDLKSLVSKLVLGEDGNRLVDRNLEGFSEITEARYNSIAQKLYGMQDAAIRKAKEAADAEAAELETVRKSYEDAFNLLKVEQDKKRIDAKKLLARKRIAERAEAEVKAQEEAVAAAEAQVAEIEAAAEKAGAEARALADKLRSQQMADEGRNRALQNVVGLSNQERLVTNQMKALVADENGNVPEQYQTIIDTFIEDNFDGRNFIFNPESFKTVMGNAQAAIRKEQAIEEKTIDVAEEVGKEVESFIKTQDINAVRGLLDAFTQDFSDLVEGSTIELEVISKQLAAFGKASNKIKEQIGKKNIEVASELGKAFEKAAIMKKSFPDNPEYWLSQNTYQKVKDAFAGSDSYGSYVGDLGMRLRAGIYGTTMARPERLTDGEIAKRAEADGKTVPEYSEAPKEAEKPKATITKTKSGQSLEVRSRGSKKSPDQNSTSEEATPENVPESEISYEDSVETPTEGSLVGSADTSETSYGGLEDLLEGPLFENTEVSSTTESSPEAPTSVEPKGDLDVEEPVEQPTQIRRRVSSKRIYSGMYDYQINGQPAGQVLSYGQYSTERAADEDGNRWVSLPYDEEPYNTTWPTFHRTKAEADAAMMSAISNPDLFKYLDVQEEPSSSYSSMSGAMSESIEAAPEPEVNPEPEAPAPVKAPTEKEWKKMPLHEQEEYVTTIADKPSTFWDKEDKLEFEVMNPNGALGRWKAFGESIKGEEYQELREDYWDLGAKTKRDNSKWFYDARMGRKDYTETSLKSAITRMDKRIAELMAEKNRIDTGAPKSAVDPSKVTNAQAKRTAYIFEDAVEPHRSWNNKDRALFEAHNPNGLAKEWEKASDGWYDLLEKGQTTSGSLYIYGVDGSYNINKLKELASKKSINSIELNSVMESAREDIDRSISDLEKRKTGQPLSFEENSKNASVLKTPTPEPVTGGALGDSFQTPASSGEGYTDYPLNSRWAAGDVYHSVTGINPSGFGGGTSILDASGNVVASIRETDGKFSLRIFDDIKKEEAYQPPAYVMDGIDLNAVKGVNGSGTAKIQAVNRDAEQKKVVEAAGMSWASFKKAYPKAEDRRKAAVKLYNDKKNDLKES